MKTEEQNHVNELLFRLLENDISDQDLLRLQRWLSTGQEARLYYCRFMEDYSALALRATTSIEEENGCIESDVLDSEFWHQLHEEEKNAPEIELFDTIRQAEPTLIQNVKRERTVRKINKVSLAIAILSAAALIFLVVSVYLSPPAPYEVATLADSMNAQWSSGLPLKPGTRITSHTKPIQLTKGIVKFMTDDNVEVILEGPSEFEFISYSEISLHYGRLFARVSEQGLGFSVATPNSKIVDLGTEFGVLCHINGDTEVFMYKGKANLFAGEKNADKTSQMLTAGSAKKVNHTTAAVSETVFEEKAVVRHLHSKAEMVWKGQPISLADIVGGGNGFEGGILNTGVDVSTGAVVTSLLNDDPVTESVDFTAVCDNPYVDGVFVPGAGHDLTQLSSTGLHYQFPATSSARWGYIFNGAFHQGNTTPRHSLELDGTVFGTPRNPAITIHSNQGITFDLSAIKKSIHGLEITGFRSLAGVSQTVQNAIKIEQGRSFEDFPEVQKVFEANGAKAEFWALLDGKEVFRREISSADKAVPVNIPIPPAARFLTLAVTESNDTHAYDWALFARPELTLESEK